jgi:F-type H+-transporting ATPase subunit alpha
MAAFAQFGSDLDATTQRLLARGSRLTELLKQPQFSPLKIEEQVVVIYAGTRGFLDAVPVGSIQRFERDFIAYMHDSHQALLDEIRTKEALSQDAEKALREVLTQFSKNFAA